jgi:hypothetical protein
VTSSKYQSHGRGRRGQTVAAQRPRRQSMAPARFKDSVVTKTLERVHQMKKSTRLPYDLANLQWDSSHRQNDTQTYCYCGNFGSWFKSMVQVNHFPYCVLYFITLSNFLGGICFCKCIDILQSIFLRFKSKTFF